MNGEYPHLNANAIEQLLDRKRSGFDAAVPVVNDVYYPLHGVYDRRCAEKALPLLNKGVTKVEALLQEIHWSSVFEVNLDVDIFVS